MNLQDKLGVLGNVNQLLLKIPKTDDLVGKLKLVQEVSELLGKAWHGVSENGLKPQKVNFADGVRGLFAFDENKNKKQRQKDNNAVFDLLDRIESGEIDGDSLTMDQKAVLAKYSGSGGGLKSRDGKTGSAHEYYTPAPVADAMWKAVSEMGFSGGKVLDPCGGSGIFGAFAPEGSIVQAIEMDKTSATVNRLVNGSENYHVDIASFEERATQIPDNSVDAIVTNVPFGDVSLRKHRNKDSKYRKENLQTYFVLRSLDKLRYGGLAAFIVPASFLDSKTGKAVNARVLTSQVAEFIGAYRLPNSVFGTAAADVATDVIFYRKYSEEMTDKVQELQAQNPEVLKESMVMWEPYLSGGYFKLAENKKFIFGEEGEIESWRTDSDGNKKKVYAVLNDDSVSNIASAIKRFQGSRINWNLLDETETQPQSYDVGDVIYQNGQAYEFDGVKFKAVETSFAETESRVNATLAKMETPLSVFEEKVSAKEAIQAFEYLNKTGQYHSFPDWAKKLVNGVKFIDENKQEQQFRRVIVGLSVQYVMDNFSGGDQTADFKELSDAMKERTALDKGLNQFKSAIAAIRLHYNAKTGYSAAWKGETAEIKQELTTDKKIEQIQYLNGTLALPSEKVIELGIDPLASDDWCVNADGSEATKADDYFVGNLGECLEKIDADIQMAKTEEVRNKLLRMKEIARNRVVPVRVDKMRFGLRSPFVDNDLLKRFIEYKLNNSNSSLKTYLEQQEDGSHKVIIDGTAKTEHDKILKRIGQYIKTGNVTHGGIELTARNDQGRLYELSNSEKLRMIREEITIWNAEFDTWLKADKQFIDSVAAKANDPKNIQFQREDNQDDVEINGASSEITLHGYQNSFVRNQAREFGGINAFGVGLGKSFSALAAGQYALETGTKRKVCYIVPNAVLSNWFKESGRYFKESEREKCLFVGSDTDKNGEFVVDSKNYARDLNRVLENKHNKIFMTQQAFEKIRLRTETAENYIDWLSQNDQSFADSRNAAKSEKAAAKGANLAEEIAGKGKLSNAPFFEDLGFDAIVVDEAHHFKNAKQALQNAQVKGLPTGKPSARAIDMNVKAWVIRGINPRKDGVLLLTATPVTNSPLEIYSMMSLAVGEERVRQAFLGKVNSADQFIEAICEIQTREEMNLQGDFVSIASLIGIKNLDLVQNLIQSNADIKEAKDVGISFKQVESEDVSDGVELDAATVRILNKYRNAYRIARAKINDQVLLDVAPEDMEDFQNVLEESGGSVERIGHPFNMVSRMSKALLDLELVSGNTRYKVGNPDAALDAVDEFNRKSKITFVTDIKPKEDDLIVKKEVKVDGESGKSKTIYTVKAVAVLEDGVVTLNCQEFDAQYRLEALLDNKGADVSVTISPKVAALVENVKKEQANIRYTTPTGVKPKFAKQIIFVESLAMHTKLKRILTKEAGIPNGRITFISGRFNSDPDEIIEVQERFNGDDENGYSIVIANKKAEVGINLQKGCQAIHHLELNWTPDSITQRNGRGIRQGNTAEKVNVYFYEANGTFDSYKRIAIDRKSNWIESVMSKGENESGFAEVGQELTDRDFDEIINMDGSDGEIAEILKRQSDRKQAELNRQALQAQDVNIGIIHSANNWLIKNEKPLNAVVNALSEAREDFKVLEKLNETVEKNIAKKVNEKTLAANQKKRDQALDRVKYWVDKLDGVTLNDGTPVLSNVDGKLSFPILYQMRFFNADSDDAKSLKYSEEQPIVVEWQKESEKQLALRQSAAKQAKQVTVDGAIPDFAIDKIEKGKEPYSVNDVYYRENSIISIDELDTIIVFANDRNHTYSKKGYYSENRTSYETYKSLIINSWQPTDHNYADGLKLLAEFEGKMIEEYGLNSEGKIKSRYGYGTSLPRPSSIISEVWDYLDDKIKNTKPEIIVDYNVALPRPYFPRVLVDAISLVGDEQQALRKQQAEIVIGISEGNSIYKKIKLNSDLIEPENLLLKTYTVEMGLEYLRDTKMKFQNIKDFLALLIAGARAINIHEIAVLLNSQSHFPDYPKLLQVRDDAMKSAKDLDEAKSLTLKMYQDLLAEFGLGNDALEDISELMNESAKKAFRDLSENAEASPVAYALTGDTYTLNKAILGDATMAGVRNYAKANNMGNQLAWVDKFGNSSSATDIDFKNKTGFKGKNTWLLSPELWEKMQEDVSDFLLAKVTATPIFN